jgi:hypothetical protein
MIVAPAEAPAVAQIFSRIWAAIGSTPRKASTCASIAAPDPELAGLGAEFGGGADGADGADGGDGGDGVEAGAAALAPSTITKKTRPTPAAQIDGRLTAIGRRVFLLRRVRTPHLTLIEIFPD